MMLSLCLCRVLVLAPFNSSPVCTLQSGMHIHSWPASILRVGRADGRGLFSSSQTRILHHIFLPPPPYPHLSSPSLFPSSDPILGRRRRGGEGTTLESGCLLPSFLLSSPSRGDQRADDPPKEDEEAAKAARDIPPSSLSPLPLGPPPPP